MDPSKISQYIVIAIYNYGLPNAIKGMEAKAPVRTIVGIHKIESHVGNSTLSIRVDHMHNSNNILYHRNSNSIVIVQYSPGTHGFLSDQSGPFKFESSPCIFTTL